MILYLLRHGRTLGADGLCVGQCDLAMDPEAETGLRALAGSFGRKPDRVFASDLTRARRTAEVVSEGWSPVPILDPRLREMDFGEWDGRSWAELREQDGSRLEAWMAEWVDGRVPRGESFRDVAERTAAWLEECRAGAGDALAVAHAGSIRALLCHALGWPLGNAFRLGVDHGRLSALQLGPEPRLLFLNADRVPAG